MKLAARFGDYNFCQMWDYSATRAEDTGSVSSHIAVFDGDRPVMMSECRVKKMPLLPAGVAFASGGPLMRPKDVLAADVHEPLECIRREYVTRRGLVLRLAPRTLADDACAVRALFKQCGFEETGGPEAYRTIVLDLAPELADIRKGLKQKWRNSLNRCEKEGLSLRTGSDGALFDEFSTLYGELLDRKGFDVPLGAAFYGRLQRVLPEQEKLAVTLAYKDSKPVAGHVASMLGDTCVYLLGASSEEGLATKAAYLLQWSVIEESKRRGMRWYDLGGIDPDGNPGVYHFKGGLGGREISVPGPFEAAPSRAKKRFVDLAQSVYRRAHSRAEAAPRRPDTSCSVNSVLCFGGEDWWYHNHGHIDMQLMKRFAESVPVLYVNSIVMRKLNIGEGRMFLTRLARKAKSIFRGAKEVMPGFHVYSPASLPVHHIPWARPLNKLAVQTQTRTAMGAARIRRPLVWVACPAACDIALALRHGPLVYQRTDRYEDYPGVDRTQIERYDRALKAAADMTVYVNRKLMAEESLQCKKAVFLDHGVDYDLFASAAAQPSTPAEMTGLKRPVVGYFGDIDAHIVDVEMLEELAALLPEMAFVFVGTSTVDTGALSQRPNVTMIPRRPYDVIPHYGKCFDVAIMPWRRNDWIDSCNPIKLKEYLALGKPVVSTPFSELDYYDGVIERAQGAAQFAEAIRKVIAEDSPERVEARRRRVADITWDSRAALALQELGVSLKA
jgi:glycosyltransferase involved in cell wall biosynthesis